MSRIPSSSTPLALEQWVLAPCLPSPGNWPPHSSIKHHLEPARVVGGMTIIEDGLRLTIYQLRTLRERTNKLPAFHASWFSPQEIAA